MYNLRVSLVLFILTIVVATSAVPLPHHHGFSDDKNVDPHNPKAQSSNPAQNRNPGFKTTSITTAAKSTSSTGVITSKTGKSQSSRPTSTAAKAAKATATTISPTCNLRGIQDDLRQVQDVSAQIRAVSLPAVDPLRQKVSSALTFEDIILDVDEALGLASSTAKLAALESKAVAISSAVDGLMSTLAALAAKDGRSQGPSELDAQLQQLAGGVVPVIQACQG